MQSKSNVVVDGLNHKKVFIKNTPTKWKKKDIMKMIDESELTGVVEITVSEKHVFFVEFDEEVDLKNVRRVFDVVEDVGINYTKG